MRQPVELVGVESLPLTTFLVLDTSGSVDGEKLAQLQAAGRALLGGLRAGDEASPLTFDEEVRVRVPPTSDRERLERALGGIRPGGATALFDALYAGTMLASGPRPLAARRVHRRRGQPELARRPPGEARARGVERPRAGGGHRAGGGAGRLAGNAPRQGAPRGAARPGPPAARRGDRGPLLGRVRARPARGRLPGDPRGDEDPLRPALRARPRRSARGSTSSR